MDRAGRGTAASTSGDPRDPRLRRNAQQGLTRADLDTSKIDLDARGRLTLRALSDLKPLSANATTSEMVAQLNRILERLS